MLKLFFLKSVNERDAVLEKLVEGKSIYLNGRMDLKFRMD